MEAAVIGVTRAAMAAFSAALSSCAHTDSDDLVQWRAHERTITQRQQTVSSSCLRKGCTATG